MSYDTEHKNSIRLFHGSTSKHQLLVTIQGTNHFSTTLDPGDVGAFNIDKGDTLTLTLGNKVKK